MKGKLLMLFLGVVLGVAGSLFLPRYLGPLLPAGLRSGGEPVEGTVVRRQRDGERLLLTINTAQGAALATFTEKVAEIDLLIEEGDSVTLGLGNYEPFVDDPPIRAVRKAAPAETVPDTAAGAHAPTHEPPDTQGIELPEGELLEGEAVDGETPDRDAELDQWPGEEADGASARMPRSE